jgi:hypothetical protein
MERSAAQWKDKHQDVRTDTLKKVIETNGNGMILTIDFTAARSGRKTFKDFGTLHTIAHSERSDGVRWAPRLARRPCTMFHHAGCSLWKH